MRGQKPTVLIAQECANAIFIFRIMDLHSIKSFGMRGRFLRFELANADLFDLIILARTYNSWHGSIEQLALLALDFDLKERANIFGREPAQE